MDKERGDVRIQLLFPLPLTMVNILVKLSAKCSIKRALFGQVLDQKGSFWNFKYQLSVYYVGFPGQFLKFLKVDYNHCDS